MGTLADLRLGVSLGAPLVKHCGMARRRRFSAGPALFGLLAMLAVSAASGEYRLLGLGHEVNAPLGSRKTVLRFPAGGQCWVLATQSDC